MFQISIYIKHSKESHISLAPKVFFWQFYFGSLKRDPWNRSLSKKRYIGRTFTNTCNYLLYQQNLHGPLIWHQTTPRTLKQTCSKGARRPNRPGDSQSGQYLHLLTAGSRFTNTNQAQPVWNIHTSGFIIRKRCLRRRTTSQCRHRQAQELRECVRENTAGTTGSHKELQDHRACYRFDRWKWSQERMNFRATKFIGEFPKHKWAIQIVITVRPSLGT